MKRALFWKCVGGYVLCVKLGGRWHYVGSTGAEDVAFHAYMKDHGYKLERVQGMPKALSDIWDKYGATVKILNQMLPFWANYFTRKGGD